MDSSPPSLSSRETARHTPLINQNFARLWSGQVVSDLGTVAFNTALVVWIAAVLAHGRPQAPLAVSGLLLAQSLPMALVRPLAGVFVDRWDARRTMLRMDTIRALLVAALLIPVTCSLAPIWQLAAVYLVILLASVCAQFFNCALFALINDIVPVEDLPRASGLSEVTWNTASVLGPPLAAPLVLSLGIGWALALNAASFVVSYIMLQAIRPPHHSLQRFGGEHGVSVGNATGLDGVDGVDLRATRSGAVWTQMMGDLREGLRFVLANRIVLTVTLALSIAMLGAGMLHALDYFFVTQSLHAPPTLYGLVGLAFGVGSIAGAMLAAKIAPQLGVARTFVYALIAVGLVIVLLSRQTSLTPALVIWVVLGAVNAAANVALMPLLLAATPRALVGRMNALVFTTFNAASLLSSTLAGWLASDVLGGFSMTLLGVRFGSVDTLLTLTGLLVCAGGIYAVAGFCRAGATPASPLARADVPSPSSPAG